MITAAFDLAAWTILFFLVGMYKPKWALFFLKKPDRFLILVITLIFVMISFTLYGEGHRQAQEAKEKLLQSVQKTEQPAVPVPVPAVIATPEIKEVKPASH
jgi:hypothetical protein